MKHQQTIDATRRPKVPAFSQALEKAKFNKTRKSSINDATKLRPSAPETRVLAKMTNWNFRRSKMETKFYLGTSMTGRQQIGANGKARGFSCDLWTDPPGQCWENDNHATAKVVTVLEGEMELEVEGQVHHLQRGEELLIPAQATQSARHIGTTTAHWLYGFYHV